MLECDDPAPTVFDKTTLIKYHFSRTIKSSTKNTRETKSTSQSHKIMFEVSDFDCQKIVLFVVLVMLPISSTKMVGGHRMFDFVSSIQLFPNWCILCSRFSNSADFIFSVGSISKQPTTRVVFIISLM